MLCIDQRTACFKESANPLYLGTLVPTGCSAESTQRLPEYGKGGPMHRAQLWEVLDRFGLAYAAIASADGLLIAEVGSFAECDPLGFLEATLDSREGWRELFDLVQRMDSFLVEDEINPGEHFALACRSGEHVAVVCGHGFATVSLSELTAELTRLGKQRSPEADDVG